MRFITIISMVTLAKCINSEVFLSIWQKNSKELAIIATIALVMDLVEFLKKLSK